VGLFNFSTKLDQKLPNYFNDDDDVVVFG